MEEITTIGLDIAKSVFQVHAISATGTVVVRRPLKRRYVAQFFAGLKLRTTGWMKPSMTAALRARPKARLSRP